MGGYCDLFVMKNMARILVAEGYNAGRTPPSRVGFQTAILPTRSRIAKN
jgi:hypothetical protein